MFDWSALRLSEERFLLLKRRFADAEIEAN
jgi:hypothetical protein